MGAALTYARRYALFTLVGIAGEDDVDAPDLTAIAKADTDEPSGPDGRDFNKSVYAGAGDSNVRRRTQPERPARVVLPAEQSTLARDRLLAELAGVHSSDEAASWAHQSLSSKNKLTVSDAQIVEARFEAKLANFNDQQPAEPTEAPQNQIVAPLAQLSPDAAKPTAAPSKEPGIRHGRVAAKTIRLRDSDHRKFVSSQPCLVCGRTPADAHHLRFAQPRALGRKVSDEFTVPVCRVHHRELHRHGNEAAWWRSIKETAAGRVSAVAALAAQWHSRSIGRHNKRNCPRLTFVNIAEVAANDFTSTNRSQSTKRQQKHRPQHGKWQTSVTAKCCPPRIVRRNRRRDFRGY
jgi:hypothetical protein